MVVWSQELAEVTVSEATTAANLRQFAAVLVADEWQRAWEAMGEGPAAALPVEPRLCRCDACGRAADLEEMVQGRGCTIFCGACRDVRTDGGWEPEEWGFDGEGEGR